MNDVEGSKKIVVLGGGVCGLYAARVLTRAGAQVTVIEKEAELGGLARGQKRGNNFFDFGVHMFHEQDAEILEDVKRLMGDDRLEVSLDAKIRWGDSFYRYPLQFIDMVKGIPPWKLATMVAGLFATQIREKILTTNAQNAEDALLQLYGKPLYKFFFKDFTHRYWGIPPTELSATFIRSKMPRLSAVDVVKKALGKIGIKEKAGQAVESALLQETLHYSRTGAEAMPRCLAQEVKRCGGNLLTDCEVTQIQLHNNRVSSVCYLRTDTGEAKWIDCDHCISTIPLPWLISRLDPAPSPDVLAASKRIRYKPVAVYGYLVKKDKAIDASYIYYRDRIFHRVGEPKNAGLIVDPPDHTLLIVEMTCEIGDPKWKGDVSIQNRIIEDLEAEDICRREEIVETHVLRSATGYPVFALGFEPHLERINAFLDGIANLQSTGRQGGFCYPNMHSAMRMGATAANAVLDSLVGVVHSRASSSHSAIDT